MPWGTSEGGTPQPYRIEVLSANWEKARKTDGTLVTSRNGENLMNLVFEGNAWRLVEEDDGSYSQGEAIEPVDGKHNRRSFLIGNTAQWLDPRENGQRIEAVRGPDEMPWAKSEVGRLINSLVELVGADELGTWGDWEDAETWAGRTYDLVPRHDLDKEGNPVTFKNSAGDTKIDWYFGAVAVGGEGASASTPAATPAPRRGRAKAPNGDLAGLLKAAYADFKGTEDEFVDYVQSEEFAGMAELAQLSDDEFDAAITAAVG
jgi:hypothetical protein